jgi:hypothetical protein
MAKTLLSLSQLAGRLGVPKMRISRALERGLIKPDFKSGNSILFDASRSNSILTRLLEGTSLLQATRRAMAQEADPVAKYRLATAARQLREMQVNESKGTEKK